MILIELSLMIIIILLLALLVVSTILIICVCTRISITSDQPLQNSQYLHYENMPSSRSRSQQKSRSRSSPPQPSLVHEAGVDASVRHQIQNVFSHNSDSQQPAPGPGRRTVIRTGRHRPGGTVDTRPGTILEPLSRGPSIDTRLSIRLL